MFKNPVYLILIHLVIIKHIVEIKMNVNATVYLNGIILNHKKVNDPIRSKILAFSIA